MALTIVKRGEAARGNERTRFVDITFDNSYPTGGEVLSQADLNVLVGRPGAKIGEIVGFDAEVPITGHGVALNRSTSAVMAFNGTTQIANLTDLSTVVVRVAVSSIVNP